MHVERGKGIRIRITNKTDLRLLSQTALFANLTLEEIQEATQGIKCEVRSFKRGDVMVVTGDVPETAGLMLSGRAKILTAPNIDGTQRIIAEITLGQMYSEPFNCLSFGSLPITVIATVAARALVLDLRTIFNAQCPPHIARQMLVNLSMQFAEKIVMFRDKVEVLSQPTLKMKVLTTVKQFAEAQNTLSPIIPFSKVEFAEYLCVNRNTVAKAIEELQEEDILLVDGKRYHLLKTDSLLFFQRGSVPSLV